MEAGWTVERMPPGSPFQVEVGGPCQEVVGDQEEEEGHCLEAEEEEEAHRPEEGEEVEGVGAHHQVVEEVVVEEGAHLLVVEGEEGAHPLHLWLKQH